MWGVVFKSWRYLGIFRKIDVWFLFLGVLSLLGWVSLGIGILKVIR